MPILKFAGPGFFASPVLTPLPNGSALSLAPLSSEMPLRRWFKMWSFLSLAFTSKSARFLAGANSVAIAFNATFGTPSGFNLRQFDDSTDTRHKPGWESGFLIEIYKQSGCHHTVQ